MFDILLEMLLYIHIVFFLPGPFFSLSKGEDVDPEIRQRKKLRDAYSTIKRFTCIGSMILQRQLFQ